MHLHGLQSRRCMCLPRFSEIAIVVCWVELDCVVHLHDLLSGQCILLHSISQQIAARCTAILANLPIRDPKQV